MKGPDWKAISSILIENFKENSAEQNFQIKPITLFV